MSKFVERLNDFAQECGAHSPKYTFEQSGSDWTCTCKFNRRTAKPEQYCKSKRIAKNEAAYLMLRAIENDKLKEKLKIEANLSQNNILGRQFIMVHSLEEVIEAFKTFDIRNHVDVIIKWSE